jgi:multicomponent Na+:H+ antiporter subunit D
MTLDETLYSQLPALQVIVPLLAVPLVAMMRAPHLAWLGCTLTSLLSFAIAVVITAGLLDGHSWQYAMGAWPAPMGIELRIDAFSALLLLVVTGASSLMLLAARVPIDAQMQRIRQPLFYAVWLLALGGLIGILVSGDAFNIFVFMEISSLATYVLVAAGRDRRALSAVFTYIIMGTIGATFYLIGVGLIYMMTGTLNLADMTERLDQVADSRPVLAAAAFITIGLALKAALFPLHIWLPNAYTRAPHIVTAFLAACSTKVAIYVLLRFDFLIFQESIPNHALHFAGLLLPLALAAMIVGSWVAMFEDNLKRLLAYSSIAQVGYILLGAGLLSNAGLSAAVLHMFNHALIKGVLFLAVACLGIRLVQLRLSELGGVARHMPWTMSAFAAAGLSLIGVPGTAGFVSKWQLIGAALELGAWGLVPVIAIVASSLMAVVYIWRIVETTWFAHASSAVTTVREAPVWMLLLVWLGVAANLYFGLQPQLPMTLAAGAAELLLEPCCD